MIKEDELNHIIKAVDDTIRQVYDDLVTWEKVQEFITRMVAAHFTNYIVNSANVNAGEFIQLSVKDIVASTQRQILIARGETIH